MTEEREDITPGKNGSTPSESVASPEERQQRLTDIMRNTAKTAAAFPSLVKTGHIIAAIDTLNRMDGLYSVPFGFNDNRVINIICDQKTAELIGQIGERTKLLPPGQKPEVPLPPETATNTDQKQPSGEAK